MTSTVRTSRMRVTVAGPDLEWVMQLVQLLHEFSTTAIETTGGVATLRLPRTDAPSCAISTLSTRDSAVDVRELIERSGAARFLFVADSLPLRPAVARVIREHGHAVVSRSEPLVVVAAMAAALMAETATAP